MQAALLGKLFRKAIFQTDKNKKATRYLDSEWLFGMGENG